MVLKIKQEYFDFIVELVQNKNGKILFNDIINSKTKVAILCENDHSFSITPTKIQQGRWCPHCRKISFEEINKLVRARNGKILEKFNSVTSTAKFSCDKGHIWNTKISTIKYGNSWCPFCAKVAKVKIDYFKEIAFIKGGKCLSDNYHTQQDKLKFVCANNHVWEAYAKHIRAGHWCPHCCIYKGEEIVRLTMEYLFNVKFPKYRSNLLVNSNNKKLELDGYNESLGIAFEHNGLQHYGSNIFRVKNFEDGYKKIISNDFDKELICKKLGIKLIKIAAVGYLTKMENLMQSLQDQFIAANISVKLINVPVNIYDKITKKNLEEMNNIANSHNGKCISDIYINNRSGMMFECNNGHQWSASPSNIKSGKWCKKCSYKKYKKKLV